VEFERCPENFCATAGFALWPSLGVVELGGQHPREVVKGITYVSCPDPDIPVIFKIESFGDKQPGFSSQLIRFILESSNPGKKSGFE